MNRLHAPLQAQVIGKGAPLAGGEGLPRGPGNHHHRPTLPGAEHPLAQHPRPLPSRRHKLPVIGLALQAIGQPFPQARSGRFAPAGGGGQGRHRRLPISAQHLAEQQRQRQGGGGTESDQSHQQTAAGAGEDQKGSRDGQGPEQRHKPGDHQQRHRPPAAGHPQGRRTALRGQPRLVLAHQGLILRCVPATQAPGLLQLRQQMGTAGIAAHCHGAALLPQRPQAATQAEECGMGQTSTPNDGGTSTRLHNRRETVGRVGAGPEGGISGGRHGSARRAK